MCSGVMNKIEKGKKKLAVVFARFATPNVGTVQPPVVASGVGVCGENCLAAEKSKKKK